MRLQQHFRGIVQKVRVAIAPMREIARLEALAEASYAAMYDAPSYSVRDCYDDARGYLSQAIKIADLKSETEISARLKKRKQHIYEVYKHQFR